MCNEGASCIHHQDDQLDPEERKSASCNIVKAYPPDVFVYAVKGSSSNSVDEMRTFDALYLRPNDERGGHFVYNINTMQQNFACQVIGINKEPIPMTDLMVHFINGQAKGEPAGVEFTNININTTLNECEERGSDSDSDFEDGDKSHETSDDSTLNEDHDLTNDPGQQEEDQQKHFNIPILEINHIDDKDTNSETKEWGTKEW